MVSFSPTPAVLQYIHSFSSFQGEFQFKVLKREENVFSCCIMLFLNIFGYDFKAGKA